MLPGDLVDLVVVFLFGVAVGMGIRRRAARERAR